MIDMATEPHSWDLLTNKFFRFDSFLWEFLGELTKLSYLSGFWVE